jgi:dienelactone hydrolase
MDWQHQDQSPDHVVEGRFTVTAGDRQVFGATWWPADLDDNAPLVLVGHGGIFHKKTPSVVARAIDLTRAGMAVAAIDGPAHGERRTGGTDLDDTEATWADYQELMQRDGADAVAATMTEDWKAALDGLLSLQQLADRIVGYWGLSMGGRFGVPFLGADDRVRAAVLGLVGTNAARGIAASAAEIRVPVLFELNTEDHLFPLYGGIELFLALGSEDKRLHVFPGGHGVMPPDEDVVMRQFLVDRLAAAREQRVS